MDLLAQALMIMTLGMGLVFVFLFLVIQGLNGAARIIRYFEGEPGEESAPAPVAPAGEEAALRAAIIAVALEISSPTPPPS